MTFDELMAEWPDADDLGMRPDPEMVPWVRAAAPWRDGAPELRPVVTLRAPD